MHGSDIIPGLKKSYCEKWDRAATVPGDRYYFDQNYEFLRVLYCEKAREECFSEFWFTIFSPKATCRLMQFQHQWGLLLYIVQLLTLLIETSLDEFRKFIIISKLISINPSSNWILWNFNKKLSLSLQATFMQLLFLWSLFLPPITEINHFGPVRKIHKWISVTLQLIKHLISVKLPFCNFSWGRFLHKPLKTLFRQVVRICAVLVTNQNIKGRSGNSSTVQSRFISLHFSVLVDFAIPVFISEFPKIPKRCVSPATIGRFASREYCVHISASSSFGTSLVWLGKGVLLVTSLKELAIWIAQYVTWVNTSESMIGLSIDDGEKVLSSPGMVESRGDEVVEIAVSNFFWMDFLVVIGFMQLVESLVEISLGFFGLEDFKVLKTFM